VLHVELSLVNLGETNAGEVKMICESSSHITEEWLQKEYREVFSGLGTIPGEYDIEVKKSVAPIQHRPHRTPLLINDGVIEKIKELETTGVISRVDGPTSWISSMVAVRKSSGKMRICIDPKDLNKAIKWNMYPIPIIEEVLPKLEQTKCFSLLDAKDGFYK